MNKLRSNKIFICFLICMNFLVPSFNAQDNFKADFNYFVEPVISKAQSEASKLIEDVYLSKDRNNWKQAIMKMSSLRFSKTSYTTNLERKLDEAVKNGDIPVKYLYLKDINSKKTEIDKYIKLDKIATFTIPKVLNINFGDGHDAIEYYKYIDSESIVQLASQYNALESVSHAFCSSVKYWPYDFTQGPRCALQAIAACKHREAAALQNKLPDAIKELLDDCKVKNFEGKDISIIEKYPHLYENGFFSLRKINDTNIKGKPSKFKGMIHKIFGKNQCSSASEDLQTLEKYLNENVANLKFLSQWVRCEHSDNIQLQVFSSAPNCSRVRFGKDNKDIITRICGILVSNQYKAVAQVAAIRSFLTGKQQSVHFAMVGQGAFCNPTEVMYESIKAILDEVKGYDVKIFLHANTLETRKKLADICNKLMIDCVFE